MISMDCKEFLEVEGSAELLALFDVAGQGALHGIEELRLVRGKGCERGKAADPGLVQPHWKGEEGQALREGLLVLHVCALHHPGLPVHRSQAALGEPVGGGGHAERRGPGACLGLHHLRPGVLDPVGKGPDLVLREGVPRRGLAQQRQDRVSGVAPDHRDVHPLGAGSTGLPNKGVCPHHVEGGHAEEPGGVVASLPLEDLRGDGDGGVDGV
mmetsp:Transcript_7948/g.28804  ORF Transcript_7948/g.28804 Transcript_7948/m.28804 type:complete len:212 (-) Transcript_7948:426-1061(-)